MADDSNGTDTARQTGEKIVESGAQIGTRLIDQAEENARQAFAAMRAAAGAKDLSQVMQIQGDYLRDQGSRAMTQAREIGDMIVSFGREAVSSVTKRG